jgi:hypothetical protein
VVTRSRAGRESFDGAYAASGLAGAALLPFIRRNHREAENKIAPTTGINTRTVVASGTTGGGLGVVRLSGSTLFIRNGSMIVFTPAR